MLVLHRTGSAGQHLVEQRLRIAHAALAFARQQKEGAVADLDLLRRDDLAQPLHHRAQRNAAEVVTLAARLDGGGQLVRIGGGADELHVRRRLFERLQQRVERAGGEHVYFVDDVDLEAALGRLVAHVLDDLAHCRPGVGGSVDLGT